MFIKKWKFNKDRLSLVPTALSWKVKWTTNIMSVDLYFNNYDTKIHHLRTGRLITCWIASSINPRVSEEQSSPEPEESILNYEREDEWVEESPEVRSRV